MVRTETSFQKEVLIATLKGSELSIHKSLCFRLSTSPRNYAKSRVRVTGAGELAASSLDPSRRLVARPLQT